MAREVVKYSLLFITVLLFGTPVKTHSQNIGTSTEGAENVWLQIESHLEQPGSDTAYHFILEQVRSHCGKNYDCLYRTYHAVMLKLERRFNLSAAIFVAGEMARLAQRQGDWESEAHAYKNLSRFHGAMGNNRLTIVNLEKALRLFEKTGNQSAVIHTKTAILEQSLSYRKIAEILPEMETLLQQAIENKDTSNINYLHLRLIMRTQDAGLYDLMEKHVSALEKVPLSDPIKPMEYGIAIHAALGRADLFMVKKNYGEAERFYQKTLRLCEAEPSRWLEIQVLHSLARLEWERKNAVLAKAYLDSAFIKAEKLQLHEHLASNFELKAMIAEAENRYAEALDFTKKKHYHQQEFDSRGTGFDMQNYYLHLENDKLAAEKEKQQIELRLNKNLLTSTIVIITLVVLLAVGLFFGLTKQRQGKKQIANQYELIRQQTVRLKQLDAAKSRFFANVSHELRTPLTLLFGPINSLLKEKQLTGKQTELLRLASQGSKRLQLLVNEILDLGKLESGKMKLVAEPVRVAALFSHYLAQFESLGVQQGIAYGYEILVPGHVAAMLDKEKCRQIIYNLLSNAFKFTQPGGNIKAVVKMDGDELNLEVSDTGKGIHPDDLPYVFDRYFQTNRPDDPAMGGTGIGLALCQEYARLFGGNITAESAYGKGSKFKIRFPVEMADGPVPGENLSDELAAGFKAVKEKTDRLIGPATSPSLKTGASGLPSILVVEDSVELQTYIRLVLQDHYRVTIAGNGEEALEFLREENRDEERGMRNENRDEERGMRNDTRDSLIPHSSSLIPDLILSDLMMPVMDGYQLLEKLKSSDATRHIPVIMLTARAEVKDRLQALRIGVDDYLTKPFDEEELLVRIENLLKNKAVRQAEVASETVEEKSAAHLPETDQAWLENFEKHVRENLASDLLTIPQLALRFAMSESTLLRQLKRLTGLTPQQYLQEMRLDHARYLLENRSHKSIAKVADEVGYKDVRSFSRSFRQRFGRLPSEMLGI